MTECLLMRGTQARAEHRSRNRVTIPRPHYDTVGETQTILLDSMQRDRAWEDKNPSVFGRRLFVIESEESACRS